MSKNLPEALDALRRLSVQVHERDNEFRQNVLQISDQLKEFCQLAETRAQTKDFHIEGFEATDKVYGYLAVGPEGLYLAHRTTEEDLDDELNQTPYEYRGYSVTYPKAWAVNWLRIVATETRLCELAEALHTEMEELLKGRTTVANTVKAAIRTPPSGMQEELISAAGEFGFTRIVEDWGKAQRKQSVDPAGAITAASSLLETTFKHIIDHFKLEMPSEQTIQRLYKTASKALDFTEEGDEHVRGVISGLSSAVQNIGALRTKTGDAHGRAASSPTSDHHLAQFAVTSAGAVSTFILHKIKRAEKTAATQSLT